MPNLLRGRLPMRRVALLYNPASGQHLTHRGNVMDEVMARLRGAGVEAVALETTAPGSAEALVRQAMADGCDTVLACGGDGTVHEALQAMVGSQVALGVIPMGTANALAADLGLGRAPMRALEALLDAEPQRVPVGLVHFRLADGGEGSRYFTVAAGIGADAHLMAQMDARLKRRLGYVLYAIEGLKVLMAHTFPLFEARFEGDGGGVRTEVLSQLLAVRIRDFGGMLHHLAPGAHLRNGSLRLLAFRTRNRFHYVRFLAAVLFGRQTASERVEMLDVEAIECRGRERSREAIYVEADGEILGTLPARMEIVPDALTLLVPRGSAGG